jgi:DDE superfamily endonuclease
MPKKKGIKLHITAWIN